MANPEHLDKLKMGVEVWNSWRKENPNINPQLSEADLSRADLSRADLSRADLSRADLSEADLSWADLSGADLSGAYLIEADLSGAYLSRADLSGADLSGADLSGAYLSRADLSRANLSRADLSRAKLSEANLSKAHMLWTILADVNLSEVHGLDKVVHHGPSSIGIDIIFHSNGKIPEVFLRGAGVPEIFIQYLSSLLEQPIQFYSVFISYSHADKSFARQLHDRLQGRGIRCWLDEHQILPGQKIHVEVDRGIRLWDKVLLCCSEHSLTSWWVNNEIELAIQKEQRLWKERSEEVLALIPLNLDGYMFKPDWHSGWKGQITERFAPDFTGWEQSHAKFEEQFERVVKALMTDDRGRPIPPRPKL